MNKSRGSALLIGLIVFFITALAIASTLYWQKFLKPLDNTPSTKVSSNTAAPESNNLPPPPPPKPKLPRITTPLTFADSQLPWTYQDKKDVQDFLDDHYADLLDLYGPPQNEKPVTLVKGFNKPCARFPCYDPGSHEIDFGKSSQNEALFQNLGKGTTLHEFIHSMHGQKLFEPNIIEEAITEAATEILYPDEGYQNLLSSYSNYEYLKENEFISSGHLTIGDNDTMGIVEFMKMQYLVPDIFKQANQVYYANPANPLTYFEKFLPPTIEGQDKSKWINETYLKKAGATSFRHGVYIFLSPVDNFLRVYILKDEGITYDKSFKVTGKFYDYQGNLLKEQTIQTNSGGNLADSVIFYFQNVMLGYKGKFKVNLTITQPDDPSVQVTKQAEYYLAHRDGGFAGVIRGTNSGTIQITAGTFQKILNIDAGYFEVPELTNYKGEIYLKFIANGKTTEKTILKIFPYYTTIINAS